MKNLITGICALTLAGCSLMPDAIPVEAQHISHLFQHFDGSNGRAGGNQILTGLRWRRHGIQIDVLEGYAIEPLGWASRGVQRENLNGNPTEVSYETALLQAWRSRAVCLLLTEPGRGQPCTNPATLVHGPEYAWPRRSSGSPSQHCCSVRSTSPKLRASGQAPWQAAMWCEGWCVPGWSSRSPRHRALADGAGRRSGTGSHRRAGRGSRQPLRCCPRAYERPVQGGRYPCSHPPVRRTADLGAVRRAAGSCVERSAVFECRWGGHTAPDPDL